MDANFNALLNLYIEDRATPDEVEELMRLIRDGAYQYQHKRQAELSFDSVWKESAKDPRKPRERRKDRLDVVRRYFPNSVRFKIFGIAGAWVAAACLTIAAAVGIWVYDVQVHGEPSPVTGNVFKGKGFYHLPDSSTILLNEESELYYTFTDDRREVALTGEAYFKVSHDPRRPFYVRTGKLLTKVLGTSFSVRSFPIQRDFVVAVTEGHVEVVDPDESHSYGVVDRNEQLAVNPKTEAVIKTARKDPPVLEWRKGFLILDNVTLKEAAELIDIAYGAKLTFKNPTLEKCEVNAKFLNDEELTTVLDVVTSALGLTYTVENGEIIIDGEACD